MLQLGLHLRAYPHQLIAVNQKLPQILLLARRYPDSRKPPFQQQFQHQHRVAPVVFLCAHVACTNLRCVSDPQVVPRGRSHLYKPLAVPSRLHSNQSRCRQSTVILLRFARRMLQLPFSRLSSDRVYPTNLLPTGVIITSYNHHRRLLPTECFGPPNRSILGYDRSLRSYPINPSVLRLRVYNALTSSRSSPDVHRVGDVFLASKRVPPRSEHETRAPQEPVLSALPPPAGQPQQAVLGRPQC